ncbi:MAG: lipopolysaccharide kinase InaA family protein [Desulfonatronovibrio sp.]
MNHQKKLSLSYHPEHTKKGNLVCVGHAQLMPALEQIFKKPSTFSGEDTVVYKERPNLIVETKLLSDQGFPWPSQVVKVFRWRGLQRLFSPFKQSKAMKSYRAARHLLEHDLLTPLPLGAVEYRKFGLVIQNAYITEVISGRMDLKKYRTSLPQGPQAMEEILKDLAAYIGKMHDCGLWHRDLNLSNFLLAGHGPERRIYLIDLNRSRIKSRLSFNQRAMDLARLDLGQWQELFFRFYCADRFNQKKMLKITNLVRARRRLWRKMIVWTNPLRRKLGLK